MKPYTRPSKIPDKEVQNIKPGDIDIFNLEWDEDLYQYLALSVPSVRSHFIAQHFYKVLTVVMETMTNEIASLKDNVKMLTEVTQAETTPNEQVNTIEADYQKLSESIKKINGAIGGLKRSINTLKEGKSIDTDEDQG